MLTYQSSLPRGLVLYSQFPVGSSSGASWDTTRTVAEADQILSGRGVHGIVEYPKLVLVPQ